MGAVRERCKIVTEKARRNELRHFDVDLRKFPDVVSFVANIIKVRETDGTILVAAACCGVAQIRHSSPLFPSSLPVRCRG